MEIRIIKSAKKKKSHYTQVLNEIAQSNKLTLEEKGLLLYFLSLPEDWKINKVRLYKILNVGRDKLNSIWKGLVEKGYIQTKYRNENGKFIYEHYVYEIPPITENPLSVIDVPITENPLSVIDLPITENPLSVDPCTENQLTYKQNETKKIKETNILELDILEENILEENILVYTGENLEKLLSQVEKDYPMYPKQTILNSFEYGTSDMDEIEEETGVKFDIKLLSKIQGLVYQLKIKTI